MGFLEVLLLILITLKLTGTIAWSWFWVLSPLIPAVIIWVLVLAFFFPAVLGIFRSRDKWAP